MAAAGTFLIWIELRWSNSLFFEINCRFLIHFQFIFHLVQAHHFSSSFSSTYMACCTGCLIFKCLTKFEDTPTFPRNGRLFGAQNWQRASLIPSLWETTLKYFPLNNKPSKKITMFENYSKCHIWIFLFWHFPPIFVL